MTGNVKNNPFAAAFDEALVGMSNTGKLKTLRRQRAVEGDSETDIEFTCSNNKKAKKRVDV